MKRLQGQVVIVTGGGRGFGRAIAQKFAAEGAKVAITARTQSQLENTVSSIRSGGGEALAIQGDVCKHDDTVRAVARTEAQFGPVSILISNAGITGAVGPIWHVDPEAWWQAQRVHVRGMLLFCRAVLPGMIRQKAGRIIVVSSLAAKKIDANFSAYAVSKATQVRFVEHLAVEVKEFGIAAFAIEPGTVHTDLAESAIKNPDMKHWRPEMVRQLRELRDRTDPAEGLAKCAEFCTRLASGECDSLSGQYIDVRENLDEKLRLAKNSAIR
jgi:NAD(P)-dependent dehydrogenase (short-subunit alcohol dehydrogenase family)